MTTDRATIEKNLTEAEDALHQLLTGRLSVQVGKDGRQVTFDKTNLANLRSYIGELKAKLSGSPARTRARGFRA